MSKFWINNEAEKFLSQVKENDAVLNVGGWRDNDLYKSMIKNPCQYITVDKNSESSAAIICNMEDLGLIRFNTVDFIICTEAIFYCNDMDKAIKAFWSVLKFDGQILFTIPFIYSRAKELEGPAKRDIDIWRGFSNVIRDEKNKADWDRLVAYFKSLDVILNYSSAALLVQGNGKLHKNRAYQVFALDSLNKYFKEVDIKLVVEDKGYPSSFLVKLRGKK